MDVVFSQISQLTLASIKNKLFIENNELLDSELLSLSYDQWKTDLPSNLEGDFSFVLYDPETKKYFCARDSLGIKALYYTKINDGYYFSSHISELLDLSKLIKKPNLKSMKTMLYHRQVDYTDTMYEGVYRLPPGHYMTIENGEEHIERYWFPEKIEIDYNITEKAAAEKFKGLFSKSIKNHLFDLDRTAFEVSGGLDSSSVVSLLSQSIDPINLDSYSMGFNGLKCDEDEYIESILEEYSLQHQKISVGLLDYKESYSLEKLYDISPNWPITLTFAMMIPVIEKMVKDGKKVLITGQGGDHLLTGTPYAMYDLFRRFKFISLYRELKLYSKPWRIFKAYIIRPLIGEKVTKYFIRLIGTDSNKKNIFLDDCKEIKDLSEKTGVKDPAFKNALDMLTSAAHSTVMDGNLFHAAENYFGIEYRHPFFEKELVEFVLSLPPEMKYKDKTIKHILRKAMDGILPNKIRDRQDKAEFSEVIIQQIDAINLSSLLDDPYIVKLGLIEQSLINKHIKEYEHKTAKYIVFLWTIINIEYWYRYNFERESLMTVMSRKISTVI